MTRLGYTLAAGVLALGLAGAAAAQDAGAAAPPPPPDAAVPPPPPPPPPPPGSPPVTNQADTSPEAQVTSSTTTPSGATDTTVRVTNGPVPDTPENRAKYGRPMSNAGKRTRPAGN